MKEMLGFRAKDRVVIINADDFGISHSTNLAIMKLLRDKSIHSASVMMPGSAVDEAAAFCSQYPSMQIGIHLTLTGSENSSFQPVFQKYALHSLVTEEGVFHRDVYALERLADSDQVRIELEAQIRKAIVLGIQPTHLDSHAGSVMGLYAGRDFIDLVFDLCEEYELPFLLPRKIVEQPIFNEEQNEEAREELIGKIRNLEPGITQIVTHPAYVSDELISLTSHYVKREMEARLFDDPEVKKSFEAENIKFTSWKAIRDLQRALRG